MTSGETVARITAALVDYGMTRQQAAQFTANAVAHESMRIGKYLAAGQELDPPSYRQLISSLVGDVILAVASSREGA